MNTRLRMLLRGRERILKATTSTLMSGNMFYAIDNLLYKDTAAIRGVLGFWGFWVLGEYPEHKAHTPEGGPGPSSYFVCALSRFPKNVVTLLLFFVSTSVSTIGLL